MIGERSRSAGNRSKFEPKFEPEKLALELLKGCGMIRRSEKRRLIGVEAPGSRYSVYQSKLARHLLQPNSPAYGARNFHAAVVRERSLPLLNLFENAYV